MDFHSNLMENHGISRDPRGKYFSGRAPARLALALDAEDALRGELAHDVRELQRAHVARLVSLDALRGSHHLEQHGAGDLQCSVQDIF